MFSISGMGGGSFGQILAAAATDFNISRSLRFNNVGTDYASHLKRTPSSASNRKTFTYSCWAKRQALGAHNHLFQSGDNYFRFQNDDSVIFYTSGSTSVYTSAKFRDISAWYHVVLAVDTTQSTATDRIKIYVNGTQHSLTAVGSLPSLNADLAINNNAVHYIGSNSTSSSEGLNGYLAEVNFVDGQQLAPTEFGETDSNGVWQAKKFAGAYGTNGFRLKFDDNTSISTIGTDSSGRGNNFTASGLLPKTGVYLDDVTGTQRASEGFGWANIFDGSKNHGSIPNAGSTFTWTPSTSIPFTTLAIYAYKDSSPGGLEINGTSVISQVPNHNGIGPNQRTVITGISSPLTSIKNLSYGSLANVVLAGIEIDGALLLDRASEVDIMFDSPTNGDSSEASGAGGELNGNYAVFNYLEDSSAGGGAALSNGNLQIDGTSSEQFRAATIPVSSGKWYFEIVQVYGTDFNPGVWAYPLTSPSSNFYENTNYRYNSNGGVYNQSSKLTDYSTFTRGDIIGTALDMDNGKVYFSKNGVWQNSGNPATQTNPAATGLTGTWVFGASTNGNDTILQANFGALPFTYNAPSGFEALNTASMSAASISNPSDHFETKIFTGNGSTTTLTTGFSPDFIWLKSRESTFSHYIADTVRGNTKLLNTNTTGAETTSSTGVTSFNNDGVTLGSGSETNASGDDMVAWLWDAGTSTVTNDTGSIDSQVRASQTCGVSVVTFTGTGSNETIGHGLGAEPHMLLTKCRESGFNWAVYHKSSGNTGRLMLNNTLNFASSSTFWNNTTPTSSVFSVGSFFASGNTFLSLCFAPVEGFSAFGSYVGNGVASDPPFVHTGFKPAWVMFRRRDNTGDWIIFDNKRNTSDLNGNYIEKVLYPNKTTAEEDGANGDTMLFLANGFKLNNVDYAYWNASGSNYLWAAFAESPFQANGGLAR